MKCSSFFLLLALPYSYLSALQPCRLQKNGSERTVCEKGGSRGDYALANSTPRTHSADVKVNPDGIRVKKWRRSSRFGPITGLEIKALTVCQHMLRFVAGEVLESVCRLPHSPPHTHTHHKKQHMVRAQHQTTVCLPGVIYMTPNKHSKIRH